MFRLIILPLVGTLVIAAMLLVSDGHDVPMIPLRSELMAGEGGNGAENRTEEVDEDIWEEDDAGEQGARDPPSEQGTPVIVEERMTSFAQAEPPGRTREPEPDPLDAGQGRGVGGDGDGLGDRAGAA